MQAKPSFIHLASIPFLWLETSAIFIATLPFCSHFKKCTKNSPLKNQTHSYVQYVNCGIACVSSREARDSYSYSKMVGYCG